MSKPGTVHRHVWSLSLKLKAPFASTGVVNEFQGVDQAYLRDEYGNVILSGDQFRGLFRHFLVEVWERENKALQQASDADRLVTNRAFFNWFGRPGLQFGGAGADEIYHRRGIGDSDTLHPSNSTGQDDLGRGRLTIRDLVLQTDANDERWYSGKRTPETDRTRIRIHRQRRSTQDGAWLVREQRTRTGEIVKFATQRPHLTPFDGVILYGTLDEARAFERAFGLFAQALGEISAMKSAGFGEVVEGSIELGPRSSVLLSIPDVVSNAKQCQALRLSFSDPLLVEPKLGSGNVQESAASISGAVLKAAIAEFGRLADPQFDTHFGDVLSGMTFRFAHPQTEGEATPSRPRAVPFSLVRTGGDGPGFADYFHSGTGADVPLAFEINFKQKDRKAVAVEYRWHETLTVSRTRTAIEYGTNHARDQQLFNYRMTGVAKTVWITEIILPDAILTKPESLKKAGQLIAFLQSGMIQIGKTRSDVSAEAVEPAQEGTAAETKNGRRIWRLALQTPASILTLDDVKNLRSGTDLKAVYTNRLRSLLAKSASRHGKVHDVNTAFDWDVFDFLAQHEFSGGHRAVRNRRAGNESYYPFVLTKAGSVFVLSEPAGADTKTKDANNLLMKSMGCLGLPCEDGSWRSNPFVPENGYGELRIDNEDAKRASSLVRL